MNLFRSFQPAASAPVARERLQILLEYDRKLGSQIDLFTVLREEILAVISRHIVDPEKVQVTVDRGAKFSTLGVNIEIPIPGDKAGTLPTDCPVLQRDTKPWRRAAFENKRQMMRGVDPAAETLAVPIWLAVADHCAPGQFSNSCSQEARDPRALSHSHRRAVCCFRSLAPH